MRRLSFLPPFTFALTFASTLTLPSAFAGQVRILNSFESPQDLRQWEVNTGTPRLVTEHATHGEHALEIAFDPKGQYGAGYMTSWRLPKDWSAFDALVLDVFNPNDRPVSGYVLIGDQAWVDKGRSYWNRHNGATTFAPGRTTWTIPVHGLYRGEAGSRYNDLKRPIDANAVVRVDFGFGHTGDTGRIVLDHLRLLKGEKPQGVWAFDFGPPSQSAMLGWTPIAHDTQYTKERGYGWGPYGGHPWNGAARETGFGPPLIRDFCEAGGYKFHVAAPPGRYRVLVIYEHSGYWGGEQARFTTRRIFVGDREAWSETRPDGAAHALWRFEDVEPLGVDIWDTYMKPELAKPIFFEAEAGREGLTLRFEADMVWGSKVAALAVHRADDAQAAAWLDGQLKAVEDEFRSQAVCLDKPAAKYQPPPAWEKLGFVAWLVALEDDIGPNTLPPANPKGPEELRVCRLAARGETETVCLAVRPVRDLKCSLHAGLKSQEGIGPSVDLRVVHYNTSRGYGAIAYHVRPHTLRKPEEMITLPKDVTRLLVVKLHVQDSAPAGTRRVAFGISDERRGGLLSVPIEFTVAPITLDRETDFRFGFFGLWPPHLLPEETRWVTLEQTLVLLRDYGMNQVCEGPDWTLKGWKDGQPLVDFGEMDRFVALLKKYGFTGPLNGYGGPRFHGLHDGYQKGETGAKVERESGLPYPDALRKAWGAVHQHARAHDWPLILYAMCDETRVREVAERELPFMHLMAKVSAAYPQTLRTSGAYSVDFAKRPTDPNDLLFWHQRFFEALDISDLNLHDESVMAEAKKLGKDVHIYNQGTSRTSFGLYQWSEWRKGVKARTQWHLNVLHGYQFFDLDGREPDPAMICYGRKGLYPTIAFERCREGAEDFYLYNTLWKLIEKHRAAGKTGKALDDAVTLLDGTTAKVKLNQREAPEGFDPESFKAQVVAAIERLEKE